MVPISQESKFRMITNRLTNAKRHIEKYGIRAVEFYPQILTKRGSSKKSPIVYSIAPAGRKPSTANLRDAIGVCS